MALFPQESLNDGVRKREVFGWAMYDFANSAYTTVVLTAVALRKQPRHFAFCRHAHPSRSS